MNDLLAWMEDNQADGKIAAENFLKTQRETWSQWVSADAAANIEAAIAQL
jgi:glycine betaine/proline transport system substrate-binding protein